MRRDLVLFAIAAFCMCALENAARADTPKTADRPAQKSWFSVEDERPSDFGFFRVEALAMRWTIPQYGVGGNTTSRRFVGIATPSDAATLYGGRMSVDFRYGPLVIHGLEVSYMSTTSGQSGTEPANGSAVRVFRDPMQKVDFGLTGAGLQGIAPSGRFKMSATFDWGVSLVWSQASFIDASGGTSNGAVGDSHLYARTTFAVCQRTNMALYDANRTWACITAAPNIYESGWLNGVAVGVRAEF
jgi:hypothetical protein